MGSVRCCPGWSSSINGECCCPDLAASEKDSKMKQMTFNQLIRDIKAMEKSMAKAPPLTKIKPGVVVKNFLEVSKNGK